jgi:UPF0176 protein
MDERQALENALQKLAQSQPGSTPYTNNRPVRIPGRLDGQTAGVCLSTICPHVPTKRWEDAIADGRLQRSAKPIDLATVMLAGERIEFFMPNTVEPAIDPKIQVLHMDKHLIAINKPAPLPVHPCGRFNKNSLLWLLQQVCPAEKLRPAHRIDAGTTGLLLISRNREAARFVQPQFERRTVEKAYLARVEGCPEENHFISKAPIKRRESGAARMVTGDGDSAETSFELLGHYPDGTSLICARPKSGRTNQIRVHLKDAGLPILGDETYGSNVEDLNVQPANHDRLHLHSWQLSFDHPEDSQRRLWESPRPTWACDTDENI